MPSFAWQLGTPQPLAWHFHSFLLLLLPFALFGVPQGQAGVCAHHPPAPQKPYQDGFGVLQQKGTAAKEQLQCGLFCPVSLCWLMRGLSLKEGGTCPGPPCCRALHTRTHECNAAELGANQPFLRRHIHPPCTHKAEIHSGQHKAACSSAESC